ncbi:uncharacterized protein LOC100852603 [Vitis vinifera]|uniref:Transmembrane protein n=2 Tax=Vitis vinifera TaxID=29760 RepID=A0A438GWV4_VITVI|nr:uncharacterized protein LOC100852603 [Vitis vinifera]RVW76685.1 hypothetical protein CK203_047579 [Vitis vinifera]|eukprot:XP_003633204.2 PREDICTED: uncharacterized protein LOC100852603 [Vitis vinifera]
MIMKSSRILLLCLLTTAFYLLHQHSSIASTSSSSLNFLPGRRHVRELSMSFSNRKNEYQEIQDVDDEMKPSTMQEDSIAVEHRSSSKNLEEIVYHIDYHGVMTHPTPTPKHPKP